MFTTQAWQDLLFPGNAKDFFTRVAMPPFELDAAGYSRANALWLMELSRLVYRHDVKEGSPIPIPTLDSLLEKANFTKCDFFLDIKTDTQAMLVKSNGAQTFAVLVFRGTEQTPKDAFIDIETGRFPLDENISDVHDGFQIALNSVWDDIETELATLRCPVFYTGHSLGAALATLAAARRKPEAVYTFGSPRVGNQQFADSLKGIPFYRVVDDLDVVTTVPPAQIEFVKTGFVHVGEEHRLKGRNPSTPQLFAPPKELADHAPVNYVDRIYNEPA